MATVVVPWRHSPERERVWRWVKVRYRDRHPDWPVHLSGTSGGPWVKAHAAMPAIERAENGVVILADADCWTDGLESAVRAVTVGAAEWAVPHKMVYRFNEDATEAILADELPVLSSVERRPYVGVPGGGIVVAHRDTLLSVPMDPRFKGPGHEDEAWGTALRVLCGEPWRGTADLIHLHHEPLPRLSHRRGSVESWDHFTRYLAQTQNPQGMRDLLKEIDESHIPDESLRDHHPPLGVG